jgi:ParB/RepB/Spo0J family partition protein
MLVLVSVISSLNFVKEIAVQEIIPSNFLKLRANWNEIEEEGILASIRSCGLLQPLVVRPIESGMFEIVCGNRRYMACKKLGINRVPCVVLSLDERSALEVALVENIQRQNLNPIEEAEAFKMYMVNFGRGSITRLASRIGKSEEYVSHRLLLLDLPKEVLEKISRRLLKPSQACELLWLKDREKQISLSEEISVNSLTFRQTRAAIRLIRGENLSVREAVKKVLAKEEELQRDTNHVVEHDPWPKYTNGAASRDEFDRIDILDHAILILRTCLVGLDMLVNRASDLNIRTVLMKQRNSVHEALDDIIKEKVVCNKRESRYY